MHAKKHELVMNLHVRNKKIVHYAKNGVLTVREKLR